MSNPNAFEHIRQYNLFIWAEAYARELGKVIRYRRGIYISGKMDQIDALGKEPSISDYENNPSGYLRQVELHRQQLKRIKRDINLAPIKKAAERVVVGTLYSWEKIRKLVWERDDGICQICNREIDFSEYNCGHIVDRVCDGSDRPENLVVMCSIANMVHKPLTETRAEYLKWVSEYKSCDEYLKNEIRKYFEEIRSNSST